MIQRADDKINLCKTHMKYEVFTNPISLNEQIECITTFINEYTIIMRTSLKKIIHRKQYIRV